MENHEVIFYIKDGKKRCTILNKKTKKYKEINYIDAVKMLKEIKEKFSKNKNYIKNIRFVANDIIFSAEDINIRIYNVSNFENDKDYEFITKALDREEKKAENKKKRIIASSMAALTFSTFAAPLFTKDNDGVNSKKPNELNDNVNNVEYEDNSIKNNLNIGILSNDEKVLNVKNKYGSIINKYCNMYDLNFDLICALAAQERSEHSSIRDEGGAIGLFQIQVNVWDGQTLNLYDENGDVYESLYATEDKLRDIDFNCQFGCAVFRYCLNKMRGNYLAALQCYNMGEGSMDKILTLCSISTGISKNDIIEDKNNISWINYIPPDMPGDSNYVAHVIRYYSGDINIFSNTSLKR